MVFAAWGIFVLLFIPTWSYPDFTGRVVSVADGDTVTVLHHQSRIKVRLVGIDAPERDQPFGKESKQALETLLLDQDIRVVEGGLDQYRRTLGTLYLDSVDINALQVSRGMAWVYRKYTTDPCLYALEAAAKKSNKGLWTQQDAVSPWKWRHRKTL